MIISIHTSTKRVVPWIEQMNEASLRYSDNEALREAFRSGAHWEHGTDGCSNFMVFLVLSLFVFALLNIAFFVVGLMFGRDDISQDSFPPGKWVYVFPLGRLGQIIGHWMVQ